MDQAKQISQAVSVVPVIVGILILFLGSVSIGPTNLGSWFFVTEDFQYTDADSDALPNLVEKSHYNYYFGEGSLVQYAATEGQDLGPRTDLIVDYSESGYEKRSATFYNISLVFYAIFFMSLLSSIILFVTDYDLFPKVGKNELLGAAFGCYVTVIGFTLFIGLYTIMAIPEAMHQDHLVREKECLYPSDIFITGANECGHVEGETKYFDGKEAILNSKWTFGPGFILFISGVLVPSLYLLSTTYQRFEIESERVSAKALNLELYFDPDAKLLFDINTGEVLGSFQYEGEDRNLFFDEDAMILWDEDTGDVLYGGSDNDVSGSEEEPNPT